MFRDGISPDIPSDMACDYIGIPKLLGVPGVFGHPSLVSVPMLSDEVKSQAGPKLLGPIISTHRSQPVSKIFASKK